MASASPFSLNGTSAVYTGGNVGIDTSTPGERLAVAGVIHSTTGGFKFPDGNCGPFFNQPLGEAKPRPSEPPA